MPPDPLGERAPHENAPYKKIYIYIYILPPAPEKNPVFNSDSGGAMI